MTSSVRPSAASSIRTWPPETTKQRVVGWLHAAASQASSRRWWAARSMPLGAVSEMGRSAVWSVQVVTGASNSPGGTVGFGGRFSGT